MSCKLASMQLSHAPRAKFCGRRNNFVVTGEDGILVVAVVVEFVGAINTGL
jgi:hypothetical protein